MLVSQDVQKRPPLLGDRLFRIVYNSGFRFSEKNLSPSSLSPLTTVRAAISWKVGGVVRDIKPRAILSRLVSTPWRENAKRNEH